MGCKIQYFLKIYEHVILCDAWMEMVSGSKLLVREDSPEMELDLDRLIDSLERLKAKMEELKVEVEKYNDEEEEVVKFITMSPPRFILSSIAKRISRKKE